jgi:hypothetical protein
MNDPVGSSTRTGRLRRAIAVVIAPLALLGVLAACGGGSGGDTGNCPAISGGAAGLLGQACSDPNGTLTVTADQSTCGTTTWSAEVFINGASQGRRQLGPFNPLSFSLQAGQYSVSVQLTDGVRTYTSPPVQTVIISGQGTNRIVTCI